MDGKMEQTGKVIANPSSKVADICERIRQEFVILEGSALTWKTDLEKVKGDSLELQRALKQMHDVIYPLQIEVAKQTELKNRMLTILNQVLEALPEEAQTSLRANIERAKTMPIPETSLPPQSQQLSQLLSSQQPSLTKKTPSITDLTQDNPKKQRTDGPASNDILSNGNGIESASTSSARALMSFPSESSSSATLEDLINTSLRQSINTTTTVLNNSLNAAGILGNIPFGSSTKDAQSKWNHFPAGMAPTSPTSTIPDANKPRVPTTANNNPPANLLVPSLKPKQNPPATLPLQTSPPLAQAASLSTSTAPIAVPSSNAGVPKNSKFLAYLQHGGVVCAVAFNSVNNNVYTCGKGCVKVWDISSPAKPISVITCLNEAYIRSCKLVAGGKSLVVAGETNLICVWDLEANQLRHNISTNVSSTFCLSSTMDSSVFYSCHNDGTIRGWDANTGKQVRQLLGHQDGVSSIEMTGDGTKLVSGGLDSTLRVWDLLSGQEVASYHFPSQIYCIGICPGESWIAVGMENSIIEVLTLLNSNCKYQLKLHESCILSLKFANNGKWFISTAKDKLLTAWRSPFGSSIFQTKEPNAVLCSDVSADDRYIVTGSSDRFASVYEVSY